MAGEVTIIGAGPAGSASALLLARLGWSVTLIEQHRFPRDKVCGECLSALGIESLNRLGLSTNLKRLGPMVLTHAALHAPGGSSLCLRLPRPMWGISRHVLDQFLLDAARDAGATILQPVRCEAIDPGSPIRLRLRHLDTNHIETRTTRQIIVADGKSALPTAPPPRTNDFGIKAHFENVDGSRDTIELFGCRGLYGGLAAIEDNRWNAAFSVPGRRLRQHRGDVESLFSEIRTENPMLARRLAGARRVSDWLAAPLPRFAVRNHWPAGILSVGNAAAALEPIGGEGMGVALRSAELAAQALVDAAPGSESILHSLTDNYRRLWRVRRPSCRLAALVVSRPILSGTMLPLLARVPPVTGHVLRMMGK